MLYINETYKTESGDILPLVCKIASFIIHGKAVINRYSIYLNDSVVTFELNSRGHLIGFKNFHNHYDVEVRNNKTIDITYFNKKIKVLSGRKNKAKRLQYYTTLDGCFTGVLVYKNKIISIYSDKLRRQAYFDAKGNINNIV